MCLLGQNIELVSIQKIKTNHLNHVLSLLRPHRYVINSVLMTQVTHHLVWGIKQLSQVGEEPITPARTHTHIPVVKKEKRHCTFFYFSM